MSKYIPIKQVKKLTESQKVAHHNFLNYFNLDWMEDMNSTDSILCRFSGTRVVFIVEYFQLGNTYVYIDTNEFNFSGDNNYTIKKLMLRDGNPIS